jgi:hypothetical protein
MKKTILVIGGIIVLVLLLAGAAFVGGALVNGQGLQLPNGQTINFGFGTGMAQSCDVTRVISPELPGPPMMRRAVLVRRQGNSLFIGVPLRNVAAVGPGGTLSQADSFDGPIVEVVVTHDTRVYQDVTFQNYSGACGQIQQVLAPGSLHDITDSATFLVWGQRNGDRIIASRLVYDLPPVTKSGADK